MPPRSRPAAPAARRALPVTVVVAVLALVAGCGAATGDASLARSATAMSSSVEPAPVAPVTAVATPAPTAPARPAAPPAPAGGLPWPSTTPADLQEAVDRGSEPWLLDPTEVAESYGAFRGWKEVTASGGPSRVVVRSSAGTRTLTLAQPGRKGQGGIWLVTSDSAG